MTEDEFRTALARGHEVRGIEYKGPGPRGDGAKLARVIRAILAMANRPDGGIVVLGVVDHGDRLEAAGLTDEDAASWSHDHLTSIVANYADPRVEISVGPFTFEGRTFVKVAVAEFDDVPVLCAKEYMVKPEKGVGNGKVEAVLKRGALYVRGHGKVESHEVSGFSEMREVIDRAAEHKVRALLATMRRVGALDAAPAAPSDQQKFDSELGDL